MYIQSKQEYCSLDTDAIHCGFHIIIFMFQNKDRDYIYV